MMRGRAMLAIALLLALPLHADAIDAWIEAMPIEARLAQLLFVSFHGREPRAELRRFGGVVFYRANIRSSSDLQTMTSMLTTSEIAPFLAVDQEGGEVTRITDDVPLLPGNMALGATQSPELAYRAGRALASDLRRLGITMNFAPVVDRATDEQSSIGIRSFGSEPQLVGALGAAFARGQRAGGVASVAKHFPGIGSASVDSHDALLVLDTHPDDLAPFRAVIDAGVEAVMLGHVVVPRLEERLFSPKLIALLREDLDFDGIVITDALEMGAVDRSNGTGHLAVDAIVNGADMVMLRDGDAALAALADAYHSGRLSDARVRASLRRILRVKLALPPRDTAPPDRTVADEIADRSVTVLRNDGVLPLSDVSLYIGPAGPIADAANAARSLHPPVRFAASELARWSAAARAMRDATLIVAAAQNRSQMQVIRAAREANPRARIVLISLGSPHLIRELPDVDAYVCVYGYLAPSQRAAARALRRSSALSPQAGRGWRAAPGEGQNEGAMGWATGHIEKLKRGEVVQFRPRGNSMSPRIKSGDLCTVEPIASSASIQAGDIVLCRVRGAEYLHFVKAVQGDRFQIGNNRGGINGWIGANGIFGRLTRVES